MSKKRNLKRLKTYRKPVMHSKKISFVSSTQSTPVEGSAASGFGPYRDAPRR